MKIIEKSYNEAVLTAYEAALTKNCGLIIVNKTIDKEKFVKTLKREKEKKGQSFTIKEVIVSTVFTVEEFKIYKEDFFKNNNLILFDIPATCVYRDFKDVSISAIILSDNTVTVHSFDDDLIFNYFYNLSKKDKNLEKNATTEKNKNDCSSKEKECSCKKDIHKSETKNNSDNDKDKIINSLLDEFEKSFCGSGFLF